MTKLKILPAEELPEVLEQPEQSAELMPNDGQSLPPEALAEAVTVSQGADFSPDGLATMMTSSEYTQDEFRQKFASILEFLENPATATNCAQELISNGRNLTADKIYNLATRHQWLKWVIDRKTQTFADSLQILAFLAVETNLIVLNWTGLNIFEKGKIWLQQKAEQRRKAAKEGKRKTLFGWVFSGRPEVARPIEPNN